RAVLVYGSATSVRDRQPGLLAQAIELQRFLRGIELQAGIDRASLLELGRRTVGRSPLQQQDQPGPIPAGIDRLREHEELLGPVLHEGPFHEWYRQIAQP